MGNKWTVPATVISVVDGDTFHLDLDLGWNLHLHSRARIAHVNAPELSTPEGVAAKEWAQSLVKPGDAVTFVSHSLDKWGRPLGTMILGGLAMADYGTELLAAGHAVPMDY